MTRYLFVLLLMISTTLHAQIDRVIVSGYLQNELNEPQEGITIFNNDSLEGTISTGTGSFQLKVAEFDRLTFKAVNFEPVTLIVTQETLKRKVIAITIREGINVLDEVMLTGNQNFIIDLQRLKNSNPTLERVTGYGVAWTPAVDRMENTFSDRIRTGDEYPLRHDALQQYEPDGAFFNIIGLLAAVVLNVALNALNIDFGSATTVEERFDVAVLKNQLKSEQLVEFLGIEEQDLYEYMYFATDHGLNNEMMQPENEIFLLQFLNETATEFKKRKKQ